MTKEDKIHKVEQILMDNLDTKFYDFGYDKIAELIVETIDATSNN